MRHYMLPITILLVSTGLDAVSATTENDTVPATHAYTNRLIHETSPYLLQHAHNPVDWYPWGDEALEAAKRENKPIFLSIGYSACHWCHVMERESFEDEAIAAILNEHFISIKVDREERPDLDEIYMRAVTALQGSGGWPMTVFLTPDRNPFYGGTYFPPVAHRGMPGFTDILMRIVEAWQQDETEIEASAQRLSEFVTESLQETTGTQGTLSPALLESAIQQLQASHDPVHGGWGGAPKFPSSASITFLLRAHARTGDAPLQAMAIRTLDEMAEGGMYDHLGGGFHRYSVDAQWLVPHFEKMLYDNAQLASAYLEAWQATGDRRYKAITREILGYILRDMRDDAGGFYSSEDADSESEEGTFYLWEQEEINALLTPEDAKLFSRYYQVQPTGNFSSHETYHNGKNILHIKESPATIAADLGIGLETLEAQLEPMRATLLAHRDTRVRPGLDDKVLTSWNALMISAFAQAARVLEDDHYRQAAVEAGEFLQTTMWDGRTLLRTYRNGEARLPGYLDDYAFTINACIDLYELTYEPRWLTFAQAITKSMTEKFQDTEGSGFFFTSDEHKFLLARSKPGYDGAEPSGNAMATLALLRLGTYFDQDAYTGAATKYLEGQTETIGRVPQGYLNTLRAVEWILYPPKEIVIVGPTEHEGTQALLHTLNQRYLPNRLSMGIDPAVHADEALFKDNPLLAGKTMIDDQPTAYVCQNYACQEPVHRPEDLDAQLKE